MLSINTNLSSLIAQNSLKDSTNILNQAIERMTTGYKINHASDNAANYSIATNMTTKIGAYQVAEDNVLSGLDLVSTATEVISMMEDRASRLSALSIQARNGTNGAQSLEALNAEAGAIASEITRLYNSTQFNNVNLFNRTSFTLDENLPQAGQSGFIDETVFISMTSIESEYGDFIANPKTYTDAEVEAMTPLTDDVTTITSGEKYSISDADELINLRELVNSGVNTTGAIFVLGADIDLSSIASWNPIGSSATNEAQQFAGTLDGNGHVIKNLKSSRGLFYFTREGSIIRNIALENVNINGASKIGALAEESYSSIENCYVTGNVSGTNTVGGLVGNSPRSIKNCYMVGNVSGENKVGGLAGEAAYKIDNCYAICSVRGENSVGGLVGDVSHTYNTRFCQISNSYATGTVNGENKVGGLVGSMYSSTSVKDSYAAGNVTGSEHVGGLAGHSSSTITNCYSTGSVKGVNNVGGLAGYTSSTLATCYSTGDVVGEKFVGGLVGQAYKVSGTLTYNQCHAYGKASGTEGTGGLIGGAVLTTDGTNFGTINTIDCQATSQSAGSIGGVYQYDSATTTYTLLSTYDKSSMTSGIEEFIIMPTTTTLHLGINGDDSSSLSFDTNFIFNFSSMNHSVDSEEFSNSVNSFVKQLQEKTTILGAVQNRLESALDEISIQYENLVSSRSTIRDADMAEVSSEYIRQQILQQASATLMATANQSPAIALQLI